MKQQAVARNWPITIFYALLSLLFFAGAAYTFITLSGDAVAMMMGAGTFVIFGLVLAILAWIGRRRSIREFMEGLSLGL